MFFFKKIADLLEERLGGILRCDARGFRCCGVRGEYVLTVEDVLSGRRFDDGICLVRFAIDVHRISNDDRTDHAAGRKTLPYHIPYRALLPVGASNLLLAGRCISGDFYAHASYRVAGNVLATGDAAGYAAAICAKEGILPHGVDGGRVKAYMEALGYEL